MNRTRNATIVDVTTRAMRKANELEIPFVHPIYLRAMLDCLVIRGVRPSAVLSSAGLTWKDLYTDRRWVEFSVFRRFSAHAVRLSGEPALGLLVGSMLLPYQDPIGVACVTSDNLGDAIRLAMRHAGLLFQTLEFRMTTRNGSSTINVRSLRPLCDTHIFVMQSLVVAYGVLVEAVLNRPVDELTVGLPYASSSSNGDPAAYVRRVEMNQACLWFTLPTQLLATPSAHADPKAHQAALQACRTLEAELGHNDFIERLRRVLVASLATDPELGELAPRLGMSARTVVRRLAASDLT